MILRQILSTAVLALCLPAFGQASYPSKPIRFVVTAPAGGASDFVGRLVGDRLSKVLGQPVVIENRAGANGALGLNEVVKAPGDGYTIAVTGSDSMSNNVMIIKPLGYNPLKDFAFITQSVRSPAVLSANPDLGVKNMEEFRKLASAPGSKLSYGSWGTGGVGHLAGEALNRKLNAGMVHVPQRGEAPVMQDLLSKTISIGLTSAGLARQYVSSGKVVPLAIMGSERSAALPDLPTMKELGFDDPIFEAAVWISFVAPARTPPAIIQTLATEIRKIIAAPDAQRILADRGLEPMNTTPEQFATSHRQEFEVITRRMKEFGIEGQ